MCPSDASVCAMHGHHEEAQAALMRVASMCDWTKQRCTSIAYSVTGMQASTCMESALLSIHGHNRRSRRILARLTEAVSVKAVLRDVG